MTTQRWVIPIIGIGITLIVIGAIFWVLNIQANSPLANIISAIFTAAWGTFHSRDSIAECELYS